MKEIRLFFIFFRVLLVLFLLFNLSVSPIFAATITEDADIGCRTSIAIGGNGPDGKPLVADALSLGCLAPLLVNAIQWIYGFSLLAGMGYFIFGGITFMLAQDEKGIKAGRDKLIWSVLGFAFIVVSFLIVRMALLLVGLPDLLSNFSLFVKPDS